MPLVIDDSCFSVAVRLKTIYQLLSGLRVIEIVLMNRQGVVYTVMPDDNVCYIGVYGVKYVMNVLLGVSGFFVTA